MDNPEKLTTYGTQDENNKAKTQYNIVWVGHQYAQVNTNNIKKDMNLPTNNWR